MNNHVLPTLFNVVDDNIVYHCYTLNLIMQAQQYPSMSMITMQNVSGKSSIVQFRYFTDSNVFKQGANMLPPKSTHNM